MRAAGVLVTAWALVTASFLGAAALPVEAARRARRPIRRSKPVVWKTRPPQTISLTAPSVAGPYRAAEARLAQFIRHLHAGRRARAAAMLASTVTPVERDMLVRKEWLREDPRNRKDFSQALFMPDIFIRTEGTYRGGVELFVIPRPLLKGSKRQAGYYSVRMRRENNSWYVDMHPPGKRS